MAIAGYVDPRKYYSNKDWGQTAFNIANGGLEMANTIMGKVGNGKKNKNGAVKCVKTVRYLEALIAYKRTHIRREKERLSELEGLLNEVKYVK